MKYAKTACEVDGVFYNVGDIMPENASDAATLNKNMRTDATNPEAQRPGVMERAKEEHKTSVENGNGVVTEDDGVIEDIVNDETNPASPAFVDPAKRVAVNGDKGVRGATRRNTKDEKDANAGLSTQNVPVAAPKK